MLVTGRVLDAIRRHGLELHVIFNKKAVMVLPSGINKASGLAVALARLGLSPHNTVAVGDAENDHAMLEMCECGVAVANAVPALQERADLVTKGDHGDGVIELVDALSVSDLAELGPRLRRHDLTLGHRADGAEVRLPTHGVNVLIAGTSGGGKTTIASGLLERLGARRRRRPRSSVTGRCPRRRASPSSARPSTVATPDPHSAYFHG